MTIRYFTDIEFRSGILITLGSDAAGDLYCRSQLGLLARIGIGSNGQLLTALNGLPVWSSDRSPNGAAGGDLSGNYPNPVIANDAIIFAKFQNIATQRLLGRNTAGSGDVEELTAATVRTILALGTAALLNTGTAAGNVPVLDANGKLDSSIVPAISITHFYGTVADQAARLAISASSIQPDDWVKQADTGVSYVLVGLDPSVSGNWVAFGDANIVASDIVSGVLAAARLGNGTASTSTWLRGDQNWTSLAAADILSGVFATARLGSGTANNTSWLRGDQTWQSLAAGDILSGVFAAARLGSGSADNTKWLRGDLSWQTLGSAALLNSGTAAGNVPVLDANGKLVSSLISLADDSVSFTKIQNITTQRLLGRNTAGSGDVEELTAATARTVLGLGTAALANTGTGINNVPTLDGAGLLNADRLGLATPSSTTFLRGDRNWVALPFVPLPLTVVTGTSQLMAVNNRYYAKNDTQRVNLTLPATATIGDAIHVRGVGFSGMGWRISNNTFTRVGFGGLYSEWGTGAYIESTSSNDCIELECVDTVLNGTDTYYIWMGVNSVGYLVMEVGS